MVLDPDDLYELVGDLPELGQPVLVHALTGFVDAGGAGRLPREHLLDDARPRRSWRRSTSTSCYDYRARRPR